MRSRDPSKIALVLSLVLALSSSACQHAVSGKVSDGRFYAKDGLISFEPPPLEGLAIHGDIGERLDTRELGLRRVAWVDLHSDSLGVHASGLFTVEWEPVGGTLGTGDQGFYAFAEEYLRAYLRTSFLSRFKAGYFGYGEVRPERIHVGSHPALRAQLHGCTELGCGADKALGVITLLGLGDVFVNTQVIFELPEGELAQLAAKQPWQRYLAMTESVRREGAAATAGNESARGKVTAVPQPDAGATHEPERTIRAFLDALYANDAATYQTLIVPEPDSEILIGKQPLTEEQLAKVHSDVASVRLRPGSPQSLDGVPVSESQKPAVGTKTSFFTQFRGTNLGIPVVYTQSGWRVDVRFWIAMWRMQTTHLAPDSPELVAKQFLFHILAKHPDKLPPLSARPIRGEDYTDANHLPGGDLDQILSLCAEMPVVRARPGETLRLPSGQVIRAGSDPSELVLVGLMVTTEIPFLLKQVNGEWKVVPEKYFEMLHEANEI